MHVPGQRGSGEAHRQMSRRGRWSCCCCLSLGGSPLRPPGRVGAPNVEGKMPVGRQWRRQAVPRAGLSCRWVLRGSTALGLSRPVINVCCFHWDALCLDLTVLFVVSSLFAPIYPLFISICVMHMHKAFKATSGCWWSPALHPFMKEQKACWIPGSSS